MIGAMASKNASSFSPVSAPMACARAGDVSGPVAIMQEIPIFWRQIRNLFASNLNQGMRFQRGGDSLRETVPVHRQRATRRDLMGIAHGHDERLHPPHFRMQQTDRIGLRIIRTERVGADEFGQPVGLVRISAAHRAHFMENNGHAEICGLPRGFRTGHTAADDVNGFCHAALNGTCRKNANHLGRSGSEMRIATPDMPTPARGGRSKHG